MQKIILLLIILSVVSAKYTFKTTNQLYNGSVTYNGLFKACVSEFNRSLPCTINTLEHHFWNYFIPASWILKLENNCVGYTMGTRVSMGPCVVSNFGIVSECSCDMNIPICCYEQD